MSKHIHIHLYPTRDAGFNESKVKRDGGGKFSATSGGASQQQHAAKTTTGKAPAKKHSLIDVLNDKEGKAMINNLEDLKGSLDGKENDQILQGLYANAKAEFKARWGFSYQD